VPKAQRQLIYKRLQDALSLIEEYSPVRFAQLTNDVERILVAGDPTFHGQYIQKLRLVELYDDYVLDDDTTTEELASTLVHESQHARLFRLGLGYEENIRNRIERLCFMSERIFSHRIPNGDKVWKRADAWLNNDLDEHFSNKAREEADFQALEQLGCPVWIQKLLKRYVRRRAT